MTAPALASPACPTWCDGTTHQPIRDLPADLTLHAQAPTYVPFTLPGFGSTYFVVGLVRDDIEPGTPAHIGITLNDGWLAAGCSYDDEAQLTPAQAREFARVLTRLADQAENGATS